MNQPSPAPSRRIQPRPTGEPPQALAPPSRTGANRRSALYWAALVLLAALLTFEPALHNDYAHDDGDQVKELAVPHNVSGWLAAWLQPWWPPNHHKNLWRPVPRLTILLQKAFHGDVSWPFYGANILLHAVVCLLLLATARRLGVSAWAAGLGALLFAVHPLHSEAVQQVVGRAEILAALWMLLGLIAFLKRGLASPHALWIQPLIFALALGSKEHAMVYPCLLVLAMIATSGQAGWGALRRTLADWRAWRLLALLAAVFVLFLYGKAKVTGGLIEPPASVLFIENPIARYGFAQRLPAVLGFFGFAATRLVWPASLSPDYSAFSFPVERGWEWGWSEPGALLLTLTLALSLRNFLRGGRGWALAAAAVGSYALVSNGPFVIGTIGAERLWYWPSAPACLGLGWLLATLHGRLSGEKRRLATLAAALLVVALMSAAWAYAPAWRTQKDYALWTLRRFPESWRGHNNLAREYYLEKDFADGLAHARTATRLQPEMAIGWDWVGVNATFLPGAQSEADAAFARALKLEPTLHEVHRHWANLLLIEGRPAQAARQLATYLAFPDAKDRPQVQARLAELQQAPAAHRPGK